MINSLVHAKAISSSSLHLFTKQVDSHCGGHLSTHLPFGLSSLIKSPLHLHAWTQSVEQTWDSSLTQVFVQLGFLPSRHSSFSGQFCAKKIQKKNVWTDIWQTDEYLHSIHAESLIALTVRMQINCGRHQEKRENDFSFQHIEHENDLEIKLLAIDLTLILVACNWRSFIPAGKDHVDKNKRDTRKQAISVASTSSVFDQI